jgi:ubiquinone biosynthesis protein COQ4
MTDPTTAPARKMEWRRAWKALRALIANSQRTDQVFEVTEALAGNSFERAFQRFRQHPDGRRLLDERPSLLETLSDRTTLSELPAGSFGRAYVEFMDTGNLSADSLVSADAMAAQRNPRATVPVDPERQFFGDRVRDMHDLWHVLTGYGMDEAGEAANLAFTLGQIPTPGIALIVLAAAIIGPKDASLFWQRYLYRAWQRGRRAALLTVAPYERLLARPLEEVRQILRIPPASLAHPDGIVVGSRTGASNKWATRVSLQ